MSPIDTIQASFSSYIQKKFDSTLIPALDIIADEKKQQFGDLVSNIALHLAKDLGKAPRVVADEIAKEYTNEWIAKIEVAGPGFLNLFLTPAALQTIAEKIIETKNAFFKPTLEKKQSYNLEFVSANPTGPLHFGHGRGGVIGDVLGNILAFVGHNVTKEFYINDAGRQIQQLGISLKARCEQLMGIDARVPEEGYHGEYLIDLAKPLVEEHEKGLIDQPTTFFTDYAKEMLLQQIHKTLAQYGITYDIWFSELTLHTSAVKEAIAFLQKQDLIYEKDGAVWFKSTDFGDDKDRVVQRANGEYTYVAADLAYLKNKIERSFDTLIMVLGHDHHGYSERLQAALKALKLKGDLQIIFYQLVKIKASGQLVRMSKRAGNIVALQDVIDLVGRDVARYFYLNRKADAQLEFDLDLALKKTDENPVYYIQYAYVRTGSILKKAESLPGFGHITKEDTRHMTSEESLMIKKMTALKTLLTDITHNFQTHLIAYYTHELAQLFNRYYAHHKVLDEQQIDRSRARLALVMSLRTTLSVCLDLMGISKPDQM